MGSYSLLQEVFPTQGSNLGLLHCRQILYWLSHWGSPDVYLSHCLITPAWGHWDQRKLSCGKIVHCWDFPCGLVVKTSPSNAGCVSIHGQWAMVPNVFWQKHQNKKQKQYCNKFNKEFKNRLPWKRNLKNKIIHCLSEINYVSKLHASLNFISLMIWLPLSANCFAEFTYKIHLTAVIAVFHFHCDASSPAATRPLTIY